MTYRGRIKNGVAVLDDPAVLPEGTCVRVEIEADNGFWTTKSVQELAAEQGVKPIDSTSDLAGEWPVEDSIEEFLKSIHEARH